MKVDGRLFALVLLVAAISGALTQVGIALASRNASGTYSLPSGNPVTTRTAISSTWANNTLSDVATEMTDSLNRSGKGAMLAALKLYDGASASTPDLTWNGDTNTGLYHPSADDVAMSIGGSKVVEWKATEVDFTRTVSIIPTSSNGLVVYGYTSSDAILATGGSAGGAGITASSSTGWGGSFAGNTTKAPIHIVAQSATPSSPTEGDLYVDSDDHKLYLYTGASWVVVGTQT